MRHTQPEPRLGGHSPWGQIDHVEHVAEGIVQVCTPSHGGIWLSPARLAQMPEGERTTNQWYEEDCEAAFVAKRFRPEFEAHYGDRMAEVSQWIATMEDFAGSEGFAGIRMANH